MNNRQPQKQKSPALTSRQRIVAAARSHFYAFGFRAVTMDDLAGELRMSKKTLYQHFPSKMAVVEAVILDKVHRIEVDLERITSDSSANFPGTLQRLLATVQGHLEEVQPPFLRDLQRDAPEMFRIVENRRRDMVHQHFGRLIGAGKSVGIIREDIPTQLIIEILLAVTEAIINPEKLTDLGLAAKDGFTAVISVVFRGVLTETGRATL